MTLNSTPSGDANVVSIINSLIHWPGVQGSPTNIDGSFSWTGLTGLTDTVYYSFDINDHQFSGNMPNNEVIDPSLLSNIMEFGDATQNANIDEQSAHIVDPNIAEAQDILNRISFVSGLKFEHDELNQNVPQLTFLKAEVSPERIINGELDPSSGLALPRVEDTQTAANAQVVGADLTREIAYLRWLKASQQSSNK